MRCIRKLNETNKADGGHWFRRDGRRFCNWGRFVEGATAASGQMKIEASNMTMKRNGSRCELKKTWLALALLAALGADFAHAQIITGGLYGTEPSAAGASVVISNSATGYRKELQLDKDGRYGLDGLNPGTYTVTVARDGKSVGSRSVQVRTNTNSPVPPIAQAAAATATTAGAAELNAVEVTANARTIDVMPIDVSTPTYLNHYDMQIVNDLPTGRSMESIALLRSNVVYDDQTTHLAVLGGASPAENRYFFNGFDTTNDFAGVNPYTGRPQVGANRLPPEALSSVDVISSSGSTSWTGTTGGLMAATVRQGSNEYEGGYSMYFTPPTSTLLNPRSPNSYYMAGGQEQYYHYYSDNTHGSDATQYLWASGPIIKDTLFLFAMIGNSPNQKSNAYSQNLAYDTTDRDKVGVFNLTWNISPDQTANLVASKDISTDYSNQYALNTYYTPSSKGAYTGWDYNHTTDKFVIANYNWHINDKMSLVVMGGYLSDVQYNPTSSSGTGLPYVSEVDPVTQKSVNIGISNTPNQVFPVDYWKRGMTAKFNWELGDHKLSLGAERYHHFIDTTEATTDGGDWTYYTAPGTNLPNGVAVPGSGQYVSQYFIRNGGSFSTINKGAYLEDYWQAAERWVVYLGARYDLYTNKNVNGENFLRMPLFSPRLGVAWDVNGDSSTKLGANLGKYGLAIPSSVNNGAAGSAYTWYRYYTYSGRDPVTQAPTGLSQLGPQYTVVNGVAPTYYNVATSNIKAPYQYEFQLYWQQTLAGSWSSSVEGGFSKLKRIIDDTCYDDGITAYAQAHGYPNYVDTSGCPEFNPGVPQVITRDFLGNGKLEQLTLPGNLFGPAPERNYAHVTFELAHQRTSDEPYFLDLSYTWSHLYGNDDGLLSLSERVSSGPGEQPLWDFPGLMEYSNGDLASDRRHALNLNGVYYFGSGLRLSSIVNMATGRPLSCFGSYPVFSNDANEDGPLSHYCNNVPAPAGTAGRLPFFWQWNAGVGYDWLIGVKNHLSLDLQVQNVTNRKGVIDRNQQYDTGQQLSNGYYVLNPSYGAPSFQAPRTSMVIFRYSYQ
jgi:hypothetical protein